MRNTYGISGRYFSYISLDIRMDLLLSFLFFFFLFSKDYEDDFEEEEEDEEDVQSEHVSNYNVSFTGYFFVNILTAINTSLLSFL